MVAVPAWRAGDHSTIRLIHWWMVFVQGDDSWMPMQTAYNWFATGNGEAIYHHVLFGSHIKFQYPPASLLIFAVPDAFHVAVSHRTLNLIGWISVAVESVATGALTLRATRDWPEVTLRYAASALAVLLTLTFYPVLWGFKEGQIQAWLSAWFVLSALCYFTGRKRLAGALIGAICIAKPQFLLFLAWGLLRREWRFSAAMAVVVALTSVAGLAVFGWANHVDYLSAISFMSHHGEAFVRNHSVNGVMNRLIGNGYALAFVPRWYAPYHPLVYWATLASSVVFVGFALFWRRRQTPNLIDFFIAGLSLTMASPIAWEHHYGILPPMFIVLALTLARNGHKPGNAVAAAALFLAYLACDVILPPIAAWASGPESLLQATVFFGALTVLFLLYRLRESCPQPSQPHEYAVAVQQIPEQPAHQRIADGAQK